MTLQQLRLNHKLPDLISIYFKQYFSISFSWNIGKNKVQFETVTHSNSTMKAVFIFLFRRLFMLNRVKIIPFTKPAYNAQLILCFLLLLKYYCWIVLDLNLLVLNIFRAFFVHILLDCWCFKIIASFFDKLNICDI